MLKVSKRCNRYHNFCTYIHVFLFIEITGECQFDLIAHILVKHPATVHLQALCVLHNYKLVGKDMDVNEHERLQFYTWTQIKVKEQRLYCCFAFNSHSRIFNNLQNSYTKINVKRPLACC